jgi:tetratricopeptide (TPR) repeat protein
VDAVGFLRDEFAMSTIHDTLRVALQHHQAGRFDDAATGYQEILAAKPGHPDASHLLGLVWYQTGRVDQALDLLRHAVLVQPSNPAYLNSLGVAFLALGKPDDAVRYFTRAVQVKPGYADGYSNLGNALFDQGRYTEAADACRKALEVQPNHADALYNFGNALCALHQIDEAIAVYQRAIQARPGFAKAHNNLANGLLLKNRWQEAIASYREAVRLDPQLAQAHKNLGGVLKDHGQIEEAAASFRAAVLADPNYADALNRLGIVLFEQGDYEEAAACYERAIAADPDFAEAYNNLGTILTEQGRYQEAEAWYRRALEHRPLAADLHYNLGNALKLQEKLADAVASYRRALELQPRHSQTGNNLGNAYKLMGRLPEACESYRQALEHNPNDLTLIENLAATYKQMGLCEDSALWYRKALPRRRNQPLYELRIDNLCPPVFASREALDDYRLRLAAAIERYVAMDLRADPMEIATIGCEPPFDAAYHGHDERAMRERYAAIFRHCFPQYHPTVGTGRPRVGMIVTRDHEGIFLRSMRGLIEHLDPDRIDLAIVCSHAGLARLRNEIRRDGLQYLPTPDDFSGFVDVVRQARFDVLFFWEVGSDPFNYFLPFMRLAPVQCVGWGTNYTSGVAEIDYLLSSALVEPSDAQSQYVERLIQLPTLPTYQYRPIPPQPARQRDSFGLADAQHVYLCAQNLRKFHPDFDVTLGEILRRDPLGVVVITKPEFEHMEQTLRSRFERTTSDVADRIRFVPRMSYGDYLGLTTLADVVLDPFHYGSGVTAYDAFGAARPIVTLPGQYQRGRYVLGCYRKMGVMECVASSPGQYAEIAVRLGTDADYRRNVCEKIAAASPALFEDVSAVREYEQFFEQAVDAARRQREHS